MTGEGAGEVQKKIFAQGKIKWKKILARQLIPKNIHAMALKKSYKEFDNEKRFLRLENSPLATSTVNPLLSPLSKKLFF